MTTETEKANISDDRNISHMDTKTNSHPNSPLPDPPLAPPGGDGYHPKEYKIGFQAKREKNTVSGANGSLSVRHSCLFAVVAARC